MKAKSLKMEKKHGKTLLDDAKMKEIQLRYKAYRRELCLRMLKETIINQKIMSNS